MPFLQNDGIRYYQFSSLQDDHLVQAIFTRHGGVSPPPWQGLNLGGTVGDDPARVAENRHRALSAVGLAVESIYDVWQVHSADVICTQAPRPLNAPHARADAILTDRPGVTLLMRFADCVPILLYDPRRLVVGIVHAGWQGTVNRTAAAAVAAMQTRYGCLPGDIRAGIGPSIGAHHYPVGPEVIAQARLAFGSQADELLPSRDGAVQFDLWRANHAILEQVGLREIQVAGLCTACSLDDWFSHRAEGGKTGRFGALIGLKAV